MSSLNLLRLSIVPKTATKTTTITLTEAFRKDLCMLLNDLRALIFAFCSWVSNVIIWHLNENNFDIQGLKFDENLWETIKFLRSLLYHTENKPSFLPLYALFMAKKKRFTFSFPGIWPNDIRWSNWHKCLDRCNIWNRIQKRTCNSWRGSWSCGIRIQW